MMLELELDQFVRLLVSVWNSMGEQTIFSNCITPKNERGSCKLLRNCNELNGIYVKKNKSHETIEFLQSSICGYDGNLLKMCCPEVNSTSNRKRSKIPILKMCGKRPLHDVADDMYHVVRGVDSQKGDWPWMAALAFSKGSSNEFTEFSCGGSLITDQHVLTAAHCFRDKSNRIRFVRLGELDLYSNTGGSPVEIGIESVFIHADYSNLRKINDIAIVKLRNAVEFTSLIQPICLPLPGFKSRTDYVGRYLHIAGWGSVGYRLPASPTLKEAVVKVVSQSSCAEAYKRLGAIIDDRVICAGNEVEDSPDSCQGDSGAPIMDQEDAFIQIGIVSYGHNCGHKGSPGVYTRVENYVDWIKRVVDEYKSSVHEKL